MGPRRNAPYSKYIYRPCGKDINALTKQPTKKLKSNSTHKEHNAMEELAKRNDLIIGNADNSGAVVIMKDINDRYIKKIYKRYKSFHQ